MNTLKQAIETYGEDKQKVVAMEELAELQKELSKSIRGEGSIDHISEEMADVEIMLEQLKLMYKNGAKIEEWVAKKIERLQGRLDNGKSSKVYKPKMDERYWFITEWGGLVADIWEDKHLDIVRDRAGNCYPTEEAAEFAEEKQIVTTELERFAEEYNEWDIDWNDETQWKYFLYLAFPCKAINIDATLVNKRNEIYFTSHKVVQQAIDTIGADRIKKYYLGVEE